MSTHNIGFYEEISKIISELSSNMHLISISGSCPSVADLFQCFCRVYEKKKKAVERLEEQLTKLEVQATDKVGLVISVEPRHKHSAFCICENKEVPSYLMSSFVFAT